ncbi:hypothetical protein CDAR_574551 [Caerostris darwini]|uniref:Uncharacterized protein n=1 Tax=Caerostris darwini TaxID=1538125 RepID=A0AAV4MW16_9ARAC|nr:hypothetical protein CDAR_574551 [Caerostris darwini]
MVQDENSVRRYNKRSCHCSIRRYRGPNSRAVTGSRQIDLPYATVWKILLKMVFLYSYATGREEELKVTDHEKRSAFCLTFPVRVEIDSFLWKSSLFPCECVWAGVRKKLDSCEGGRPQEGAPGRVDWQAAGKGARKERMESNGDVERPELLAETSFDVLLYIYDLSKELAKSFKKILKGTSALPPTL